MKPGATPENGYSQERARPSCFDFDQTLFAHQFFCRNELYGARYSFFTILPVEINDPSTPIPLIGGGSN